MFEYEGPFRNTDCPLASVCRLLNCIFRHSNYRDESKDSEASENQHDASQDDVPQDVNRPRKRLRLGQVGTNERNSLEASRGPIGEAIIDDNGSETKVSTSKVSPSHIGEDNNGSGNKASTSKVSPSHTGERRAQKGSVSPPRTRPRSPKQISRSNELPSSGSMTKHISPPPKSKNFHESTTNGNHSLAKHDQKELKSESLNPRLVPKPPATHAVRHKLLVLLHEQMVRLNQEIQQSDDEFKDALQLSPQELISQALDEEEQAAKFKGSIYTNVLKLRIVALKKMELAAWKEWRTTQIAKDSPADLIEPPKPTVLDTGLTAEEEIALLPDLISSQESLQEYGYVTAMISEGEIEKARAGVEDAGGFEVCDRCDTRFQVFPGRREDGELTSGGKCVYHWGRFWRSNRRQGTDQYSCCGGEMGSRGCETANTHVFKVTEAKRLASILQFEKTPTVGPTTATSAVCFDCEMGYTTQGMELIRITATAWPDGKELLDVLVRPIGEVLDLNSRFSGVWPKEFTEAEQVTEAAPYECDNNNGGTSEERLRIVESPAAARKLLFSHLTTSTPLIGHALENDLNAVRIIHPTIIDTVVLFPHPRGLPRRNGLKYLAREYLDKNIQTGGAQGHDSKEDARAAGELVRFKIAERWRDMKREGWTVSNGVFNPPEPF